ncbi:MAG: hypothetical protein AB1445_09595 [Bacillota bacterium]
MRHRSYHLQLAGGQIGAYLPGLVGGISDEHLRPQLRRLCIHQLGAASES